MKYLFLVLTAFFLLSCIQQKQEKKNENEHEVSVNHLNKIELKVDGMVCTGCENSIVSGVKNLDGVKEVAASHTEGTATVVFDSTKVSVSMIAQKIKERGYEVTGHSQKE